MRIIRALNWALFLAKTQRRKGINGEVGVLGLKTQWGLLAGSKVEYFSKKAQGFDGLKISVCTAMTKKE